MPSSEPLSDAERAAIEQAVAAAERASGAELVPLLIGSASDYRIADARGALFGALAGAGSYLFLPVATDSAADVAWLGAVCVALGALGGLLLARWPRVRRALAGSEIDECVDLVAAREFLARGVFRTERRTGILLLVALFEHRVRVLADEEVYRAVPKPIWERVAADAARAMSSGRAGEAMLHAVEASAALVAEHGPRRSADDANELPDSPVTSS